MVCRGPGAWSQGRVELSSVGRRVTMDAHGEDVACLRAQGFTGRAIARELGIPSLDGCPQRANHLGLILILW